MALRVCTFVVLLAAATLTHAFNLSVSGEHGAVRKLRAVCEVPHCKPADTCIMWENPCSKIMPYTPSFAYCGACPYGPYGEITEVKCPSVACASSFVKAIAGPGGCASAMASVKSTAVSQSVWKTAESTVALYIQSFIEGKYSMEGCASAIARVYASAVATTMTKAFQTVCYCCDRPGYTKSTVEAAAKAVSIAASKSIAAAFAMATIAKYPDWFAAAAAEAEASAVSIEAAATSICNSLSSASPDKRYTIHPMYGVQCQIYNAKDAQEKIAKALACTSVSALAAVYSDPAYGKQETKVKACSSSYAVAGLGADYETCPVECKCQGCTVPNGYGSCECAPECAVDEYGACTACIYVNGKCQQLANYNPDSETEPAISS